MARRAKKPTKKQKRKTTALQRVNTYLKRHPNVMPKVDILGTPWLPVYRDGAD